jgi:fumarate hydratase subunit beta
MIETEKTFDPDISMVDILEINYIIYKLLSCNYHFKKYLPINIKDEIIYYVGPTPNKNGQVIGSAGPTTSYRMDSYAPRLLDLGLKGMNGKGARSKEVIDSIKKNKSIYFGAIGGAGALMSKCIVSSEVIAYDDLGAEAIRKLEVKDMPLVVIIDANGNNLYEIGKSEYLKSV